MSTSAQARVKAIQDLSPSRYPRHAPGTGADSTNSIVITTDESGWVTEVSLNDLDPSIRTAAGLRQGLEEAIAASGLAAVRDETAERSMSAAERERGEEVASARRRITAPPMPPPLHMTKEQLIDRGRRSQPSRQPSDQRTSRDFTGTSREGEVVVKFSWLTGFENLVVDDSWLSTATPDMLRYALTEALEAVYAEGEAAS